MSTPPAVPPFVPEDLAKLNLEVAPEELSHLARYLDLLLETNEKFNLTAIKDRDSAWKRHIIDSLTVLPAISELPANSRVADVGSGGGLPGIPLAIARPDLQFTLIEATGKKARFLEECTKTIPLPNVRVVNVRAEQAGQDKSLRETFDVAVCRALGPMRELLEYTMPLVSVGGWVLAMKGPNVETELEEAGDALHILGGGEITILDAYPENFGIETVVVVINKTEATPKPYPRAPGTPRLEPL